MQQAKLLLLSAGVELQELRSCARDKPGISYVTRLH
jgi:hypothetical protein